MNKEQTEILNRVKLFMSYDNKKTLNENFQSILNEQSDQNWKTKYPCVVNYPGSKPAKLTDGTTAYEINGIYYYNNGMTSSKFSYNCKSPMFQYPKNQADGDKFRTWFYKNYSNNPVLGNVAKEMGVDKTGLYNSKQLLKAWEMYGDNFLKSEGGKLSPDEIVYKQRKAKFDENGFMTIDAMNSLLSPYNQKINGNNEFDMPYIPCTNNDEVYAAYGLWFFQKVNEVIFMNWNQNDNARCKNDGFTCSSSVVGQQWLSVLKNKDTSDLTRLNEKDTYSNICMCYNSDIAYGKPFEDIDKNNLTSTAGKLDNTSLTGYNGVIPSFADIIKTYGTADLKMLVSLLNKTKYSWYYGDKKNVKPNAEITYQEISNLLAVVTIATAFIPIAGPILSIGFGVLDATLAATWGKDPEAAEFMLILAVLPELSIAKNLFKSAKYVSAYKSLLSKTASGSMPTVLTQTEKELIEQLKQLDPSSLNSEIQQELSRTAQEILAKEKLNPQLAYEELEAVKKAAYGNKSFVMGDLILGIAPAFATKYGRDLAQKLGGLFTSYMSRNNIDNLPPEVVKMVTQSLTQAAETTPEESDQKQQMDNLLQSLEKNPSEFDSLVKNENTQTKIVILTKNKLKEKNLEVLDVEDIEALLAEIPD